MSLGLSQMIFKLFVLSVCERNAFMSQFCERIIIHPSVYEALCLSPVLILMDRRDCATMGEQFLLECKVIRQGLAN